ncbi:hypothetical protein MGYG_07700 [Nannizzia gypsea CBS 118893]|uniref:Uncharacterized protein n=1 Tax=Arthroderma gypseum (strain ATCC MYA-4604 / CBS 118893) TaxID=535722 RepID=E4V3W9_ARTGP|nr:hypothetical protein MGYG_07700 [Nannizzia gypsea CBS 118893]EFR04693.1 hypothetical protein MGYG_07700 [Nannizzia gypsea CBS 118893]
MPKPCSDRVRPNLSHSSWKNEREKRKQKANSKERNTSVPQVQSNQMSSLALPNASKEWFLLPVKSKFKEYEEPTEHVRRADQPTNLPVACGVHIHGTMPTFAS